MVCCGSHQTNLDGNGGSEAWLIRSIDIDRYIFGSLTTTSQVENTYRPELTVIYEILALLVSVYQIYQLQKLEADIGWYKERGLYKESVRSLQISSNTKHENILREIQVVSNKLQINIRFWNVYGNQDDNWLLDDLPLLSIIYVEFYIRSKSELQYNVRKMAQYHQVFFMSPYYVKDMESKSQTLWVKI